jgi:hypothetical protein
MKRTFAAMLIVLRLQARLQLPVTARVILEVPHVSFSCPTKNEEQILILKVTLFLKGHKNDTRETSNITRLCTPALGLLL